MSSDAMQPSVLRYLRAQAGGALTDGELLARYAQGRDEAAFAAVVQRYGGLVLGVARRQLPSREPPDRGSATPCGCRLSRPEQDGALIPPTAGPIPHTLLPALGTSSPSRGNSPT